MRPTSAAPPERTKSLDFPQDRRRSTVTISTVLWYAPVAVEPKEPARPSPGLSLAGAGSVLIGSTAAVIALGSDRLVARLDRLGFLVGALLGLPAGVFMTYKRYGHAL